MPPEDCATHRSHCLCVHWGHVHRLLPLEVTPRIRVTIVSEGTRSFLVGGCVAIVTTGLRWGWRSSCTSSVSDRVDLGVGADGTREAAGRVTPPTSSPRARQGVVLNKGRRGRRNRSNRKLSLNKERATEENTSSLFITKIRHDRGSTFTSS